MARFLPAFVLALLLATPAGTLAQTLPSAVQPSANWAGYVGLNAYYSGVSALIEAPTPAVLQRYGASASWVGIGGWTGPGGSSSQDLIQAGITEVHSGPIFGYRAWYEMLPAPPVYVPIAIQPAAWVLLDVHEVANDEWQISVVNGTNVWTQRFHYASSHASAEWILEAPALVTGHGIAGFEPLAGVTGANFGKMAVTANGRPAIGAQLFPVRTAIVSPLGLKAVPTALEADGASFSVVTVVAG